MTDKERAQFDHWQKQWDVASAQFAKDFAEELAKTQPQQQPPTSWLTNTPLDRDYQEKEPEGDPSWHDIYARSQNIDGLLTEADARGSKGEKKPEPSFGGFTPTKTNPTQQSTIGPDGLDPDGGVRVTPNWSDSDDLRELDDIKRRIEAMERKCHAEEFKSEKPSGKLRQQLESLRDRVQKLSEKINRTPEVDVT